MKYYMDEYLGEFEHLDELIHEDSIYKQKISFYENSPKISSSPKLRISYSIIPKSYIINKDATILFWDDGEKTIVKRCDGDKFNPRLGFLTAYFQHLCGMSKNKANKYLANLKIKEPKMNEKRKPKHMKEEK